MKWCFAGLYARPRPGAGQSRSGISPGLRAASGLALGNLGVVFRRVVRAPPARRWAILEWCFAGLYTRPTAWRWAILEWCFAGLYARPSGPALGNLGVVF
ncbi:MAG: hypothetical protein WBW56_06420, partial [Syntrophobacteraceae bacterium]